MNLFKLKNKKGEKLISRAAATILSMTLIAQTFVVGAANEKVINSFNAVSTGQAVINNLKYTDIAGLDNNSKNSIFQNGALGIYITPGSKKFNPKGYISKEMALYLIYTAANRVREIDEQGQALNSERTVKKTNPQDVLFDGSLQLAANDGLISETELADAMQANQKTLGTSDFRRSAPVQRQEFATWIAKALMIPPEPQQQELLNNFSDWKSCKPENIPYLEAVLRAKIMNGNGSGKFLPAGTVTRQQAAAILKNAEDIILPLRRLEQRNATIVGIQSGKDNSNGSTTVYTTITIRNSDGLLDEITVSKSNRKPVSNTNELTVSASASYNSELPVFKNGKITGSVDLRAGDRIQYIAGTEDLIVRYVRVLAKNEVAPEEVEKGLYAGIVEENNPQLGYITLYNEDGTGKTPLALSKLKTYNYADPNDIQVFKNHEEAELDDIEAGDTVFIRVDSNNLVTSVSSVANYTLRYGKIISKKLSSIIVEFEKKQQKAYNIDRANVIKDGKLVKYSQLKDGDTIKLLINEAPNMTVLKEIMVEGGDKLVSNIYKGTFDNYNSISNTIYLNDPWTFRNGKWIKETNGSKVIELGNGFSAFFDGQKKSLKDLTLLKDNTVYIASEKDYGNDELAVVASFTDSTDKEVPYDDKVYITGTNRFVLEKNLVNVTYNPGTIVVKDGRLVQGSSVSTDDYAYVMANRDNSGSNSTIVAGVVSIEQRPGTEAVQLYRGRISNIDEYKTVTLESYSKLNGTNWDYANTPMTFSLSSNTRITDTDGIVGQGSFTAENTQGTFKGRTVYILSDGTDAVEISTAPFGNFNIQGTVNSTAGGTLAEDGSVVQEPQSIILKNCRYYNTSAHLWVTMGDSNFNILKNSLILRNNKKINASDLKKGDSLRILKKDNAVTGDAYIIIVE
ncbi:S-layer homology domain-containing protein [Clostridium sp. BNL1100]|uniref:S-layer homology domain-containing protein n=1 Tax=Clostridium sp. BNL1100 TaxID=755731 RepID=UPI00024A7215|nr:S-layer homology domain-containing protein [Clostridium sp. BNL1100]AEY64600.1 putative S-layer protein [Clostridium sp. BNL1100]